MWRSFHYDETSETVDAYVNRIRQVVAVLGYEELQILEVFKNTIPNRLYWVLFPIDNLRVSVETAKRLLTKEKIDRQMSGQSSTTPFMKASSEHNHSSKKNSKKGVTFDVMETIERNSNSIDNLTCLVSKMNMIMDKWETQYKPQIYQSRNRGHNRNRQDNYQPRNISYSRDRNQYYNRGRGNYNRNNYRSNYRDRSRDNYRHNGKRNNYRSNERHDNYRSNDR